MLARWWLAKPSGWRQITAAARRAWTRGSPKRSPGARWSFTTTGRRGRRRGRYREVEVGREPPVAPAYAFRSAVPPLKATSERTLHADFERQASESLE